MSIESRSRQYGKVFDHWRIRELLGSGSGGKTAVFRLTRIDSSRGVSALKIVNLIEERGSFDEISDFRRQEYQAAREECSRSAEQEVWLMDELRGNTNIVDYLDHTFVDWSEEDSFGRDLLIRMELLTDLRSELRNGRMFTEAEVLKIGRDICIALELCHNKNILHRDVKPENIFRNKDGAYKLGDFGVSRVLDACPGAVASTGIGTYEYWPAEQMTGSYDKRVDIYSLGLVLYELSNRNRLPFASSTYVTGKEVSLRLSGAPMTEPTEVSPALARVILKACAFRPADRYQSAEDFLKALDWLSRKNQPSSDISAPKSLRQEVPSVRYETIPARPSDAPNTAFETQPALDWEPAFETQRARSKKSTAGSYLREQDHRKKKMLPIFLAALLLCAVAGVFVGPKVWTFFRYSSAKALSEEGKYNQAVSAFESLGNYRDSLEQLESARLAADYEAAKALSEEGKHEEAIAAFEALGDYRDSADQMKKAQLAVGYEAARALLGDAIDDMEALGVYSESVQQALSKGSDLVQRMRDGTYTESFLDENDNVICVLYRNLDGTILRKFTAEYDGENRLLCQLSYDTSDSLGCIEKISYTENGDILNREIKLGDGTVYRFYTYQYREDGQMESSFVYDGDGAILEKTENFFEGDAPTRFVETNEDGSYSEGVLDENGCAPEIRYYDANGSLLFYTENTFDAEGRETLAIYYNPDGSVRFTNVTDYNALGKKTRYTFSGPDGEIVFWNEFSYDAIGRNSNMKNYANGGENYYFHEYVADITEKLIREACYGSDGTYTIMYYDVLGNEKELFAYDKGGRTVKHEMYEYDEHYNFLGYSVTEYNSDGSYSVIQYNSDREYTKAVSYDTDKTISKRIESFFDDAGRPIKEVATESDGFIVGLTVITYEEDSDLVTACVTTYNRDGSYSEDYSRNAVTSNVRETVFDGFNRNLFRTVTYDSQGNAVGETQYTYFEDKLGMTVRYTDFTDGEVTVSDVDENERITTQTVYDANGNVMGIMEYEYNELGQRIRINHKRPSGYLYSYVEYEYNADGDEVGTKWYVPG